MTQGFKGRVGGVWSCSLENYGLENHNDHEPIKSLEKSSRKATLLWQFDTTFASPQPSHTLPQALPHLSSGSWVIHISSLASTFPILFLLSPAYFVLTIYITYSLYLSSIFPPPPPADNPPCDLHFCGSVPVLVVCLVHFGFCVCCFRFTC